MAKQGVNKVILVGRVGQDPEVRYSKSGVAFSNISMATSETWKDKQTGEKKERTEWHKVVFSGRLAEIVGEYVKKGSKLYVEGVLRTRKWQDQSGQDRYTTEINVGVGGEMQILERSNSSDLSGHDQHKNKQQVQVQSKAEQWYTEDEISRGNPAAPDEDIPF